MTLISPMAIFRMDSSLFMTLCRQCFLQRQFGTKPYPMVPNGTKPYPNYNTYLQATIMPKLTKKVMQPIWLHGTNPDWTNNNSESGNHVMKLVAGWKPQQLLDLVDMLHSLTQQQFGEVVKVFAGRGEFALAERYLQHNMDHQVWASQSRDAQQRHVKKIIEARKPAPTPGTARSTDGKLLINVKKTAGKKPHQKQRPKANRTRTISQSNK